MELEGIAEGDLVVTADVPLAARVVTSGAVALNPRGTLYTTDNIGDHLAQRDPMDELRSSGAVKSGTVPLSRSEVQAFARQLDKFLAAHAQ